MCGWHINDVKGYTLLNTHHIKPVSCGGSIEDPNNLVVLCPNHHAIAHRVGKRQKNKYFGPKTKDKLISEIKLYEESPEKYSEYYSGLIASLLANSV